MGRKSRCIERLPWVHDDPRKAFVFVQVVHKGGVGGWCLPFNRWDTPFTEGRITAGSARIGKGSRNEDGQADPEGQGEQCRDNPAGCHGI